MSDYVPPAWPFLLAAVISFVLGLAFVSGPETQLLGWFLIPVTVLLALVGIHLGRRALAAGGTISEAASRPTAPTPIQPPAATDGKKETSVGDYTSVAAVKAIPRAGRACPECHSPVTDWAKECPTCSTALR